jgi:hypothetical protein
MSTHLYLQLSLHPFSLSLSLSLSLAPPVPWFLFPTSVEWCLLSPIDTSKNIQGKKCRRKSGRKGAKKETFLPKKEDVKI